MLLTHPIHVISTGQQSIEQFSEIVSSIHEQVDFIHIREKSWSTQDHVSAIERLLDYGVPLEKIIVNDRVDVAVVMKVGGVQLGYHSLAVASVKEAFPHLKVGRSVHSIEEAISAEKDGADYVLYGHIFETASKPGLEPRGLEQLTKLVEKVDVPVIAIGGIQPVNAAVVLQSGASGVAVLSGILQASDPLAAVETYREKMCKGGAECKLDMM